MSRKKLNRLCEICGRDCKQDENILVISCPHFRDLRLEADKKLGIVFGEGNTPIVITRR